MKKQKWFLAIGMFCVILANANATLQIGVATDKDVYQLGETVKVFVTAYNPSDGQAILNFGTSLQATYLMDSKYDWSVGKWFAQWTTAVIIEPYDSYAWVLPHGTDEMAIYPLTAGVHIVQGEVLGYGESLPVEFQVVPEPFTISLLGFGYLLLRKYTETIS